METRRVSEDLKCNPRLRVGLTLNQKLPQERLKLGAGLDYSKT